MWKKHEKFERHSLWLVIGIVITVSIGGLVEIAPLFWVESTIEEVEGVRPYTPLELAGRDRCGSGQKGNPLSPGV